MARLKGGKLFLDLTNYELDNGNIRYELTDEQTKCIVEKGLIVKLKLHGHSFVFEPNVSEVHFATDDADNIIGVDGFEYNTIHEAIDDAGLTIVISYNLLTVAKS